MCLSWMKAGSVAFLYLVILFFSWHAHAQTMHADDLIDAWAVSDTSQTRRAAATHRDLADHFNKKTFEERVRQLDEYLQRHPDRRLRIRTFMYESFGYELLHKFDSITAAHYLGMMQEAAILGDEQLSSELYAKFAEYKSPANRTLYYLLKAIEIRERIGVQHFTSVAYDYYTASAWLYETMDYRNSANYGVKGVAFFRNPQDFLFHYVLALDITGASYLKLGVADSAILYYEKIKHELEQLKANPVKYQKSLMPDHIAKIWEGIAKGGIAQGLVLKEQYDSAYALLLHNLQSSVYYREWDDAALAQNTLARIEYIKGNYRAALIRYRQARVWALPNKKLTVLIPAVEGVSSAFAALNMTDSAFFYQKEYIQWKDSLQKRMDENRLDLTNAKVEYENMQAAFDKAQKEVTGQKRLRNTILAGIAVLAIIALLLYNRNRLKHKLRHEMLEREKQQAQSEAEHAKQRSRHGRREAVVPLELSNISITI